MICRQYLYSPPPLDQTESLEHEKTRPGWDRLRAYTKSVPVTPGGIEPPLRDRKSRVLPLNDGAINTTPRLASRSVPGGGAVTVG